jgi:transposase
MRANDGYTNLLSNRAPDPAQGGNLSDSDGVHEQNHCPVATFQASLEPPLACCQGLVLKVLVLPANFTDAEGGQKLLENIKDSFTRHKHLFVDGGYKGSWREWVEQTLGWTIEVVQRPDANFRGVRWPNDEPFPPELEQELLKKAKGFRDFVVIPRRWVVERTFAWFSFYRRLNRDYDLLPQTTAFIYTTMPRIMLRRLAS